VQDVTIYTDGACSGNPGPGGWAALLFFEGQTDDVTGEPKYRQEAEGAPHTTNNKMELTAALKALESLDEPAHVQLHTDSRYLVNAFNKGWLDNWQSNGWKTSSKKPVKNKALWKKLLTATERHEVEWIWVKGHAGNEYNVLADEMAVTAMEAYK
jgi:ribonuclease HI